MESAEPRHHWVAAEPMDTVMPHDQQRNQGRTRLQLSRLESRELPAVLATFTDSHTLVLKGDADANTISIVQNDRAGTLTVTGAGAMPLVFPASKVDTVIADMGAGNDRFEYRTVGDVRYPKILQLELGEGDDTGIVRWTEDGAIGRAGLTADVFGGAGSDAIGFRVGSLSPAVAVSIRADGEAGVDALGIEALAPGRGSSLDVSLSGGDGDDNLAAYPTGDTPSGSRASYRLFGDAGDDMVVASADGRVRGNLDLLVDGGTGNDQVGVATMNLTGPNKARVTIAGGVGDDQLFTSSDARTTDAFVDGGDGNDGGSIIAGARTRGVEFAQPPAPYDLYTGPGIIFNPILPTTTIRREGRAVEYWTAGKSSPGQPVVVLITGYGGTIDYWESVPGKLAANSQVIAINRPGYGRTSLATGDYDTTTVEDIRAVVKAVAGNRPILLVGHSLGGLYANLFARLHPDETAGVVFVDATAPEVVARASQMGFPNGGLGDLSDPGFRLDEPGVPQETAGVVQTAETTFGLNTFPAVPVVSLRAGPADLLAADPQADAWYEALGKIGSPSETRRIVNSGHHIQFDRPNAVIQAVADVLKLATKAQSRTTLTAETRGAVAGDPVVLKATINGGVAAGGVVTFKFKDSVLGTASVENGVATLTSTDIPAGRSRVVAEYAGDRLHLPSQGDIVVRQAEPSADRKYITGVLVEISKKFGIPGMTASVVVNDKVIAGGSGVRQAGSTDKVQVGDRFANGSTTKAMTATLAGVLVEKGLIDWNSTIGSVFPELKGKIKVEFENTTVEDLLRHRSGLINGNAEDSSAALLAKAASLAGKPPEVARREILETLLNEPLANAPGVFLYSNAGYAVVAAMLERVGNGTYEQMMSRYVFDPLGMASATFDPTGDIGARVPLGTNPYDGKPVTFDGDIYQQNDLRFYHPAGMGLRMNVADWAKFIRMHMGQTVNGVQLLSSATLERLHTPDSRSLPGIYDGYFSGYASGWGVRVAGGIERDPTLGSSITHDGSDGFWLANVEAFPTSQFAVLIMANSVVDATGNDLEFTAFAEVQRRLTERFAPKPAADAMPLSETVGDTLKTVRTATGVPAIAAGVIVDGVTQGLSATGVKQVGKAGAMSVDDRFHLGSNSKSMTATLAAILVEKGVIKWDTTIGQIFPELRGRMKGYADATLEDLLNHRAGFGDIATQADISKYQRFQQSARFASEGRQAYVRDWLLNVAPANARGVFNYSNIGYSVAGAMLERAANRGFEWLMRENVFQPLGMSIAVFGLPAQDRRSNQPLGHDENGKAIPVSSREPLDLMSPSGGVSMTMADWAKYLRFQLGEPVNGVRLVSPETLTKLHTPDPRQITDDSGTYLYGFGWRTVQTPLGEALGHEGAVPGFYSRVGIIPSKGIALFSAVNQLSDSAVLANQSVTDDLIAKLGA